ncbi:CPBP family glutamic-type intramembrane protease [Cohnella caldifontis]|uniref:CPBP family glutamic-type intramembrane protease n=1 Tax=Cohnella caldifontis TaxID=3027471 RepID=UPI0023ED410E|nr:CPBP family glutamic-type intramembrane protease [Cohnella sp. YIM B05605]
MRRIGRTFEHPGWWIAAGIGLVLFLLIQVFPILGDHGGNRPLSRETGEKAALAAAREKFGVTAGSADVRLTHLSDSEAVGYFAKEKLTDRYDRTWAEDYPTDVYRADFWPEADSGTLTLYISLESGKLVAWRDGRLPAADRAGTGETPASSSSEGSREGADRALQYAAFWGVKTSDWEWDGNPADPDGKWTFLSRKGDLGEARLVLEARVPETFSPASSAYPPTEGGSVTYDIRVPEAFSAYLAQQKRLASRLNAIGFVLPELVLLVLSIVYAAARRSYASFRRGLGLTAVFLILYTAFYFNLLPGFRAGLLDEGITGDDLAVLGLLIINLVILACMGIFTYFSAVAGDGLWRSMGRNLWPRWKEAGYGQAVLTGMKQGYPLAFLLLGVQSVILLGLEQGIGMFQSTDASQSSPNMTLPWLLLALAWCTGISEELQSRLFGIGLFRSWLLGGAKRALGRPPSPRAETWLTLAAMIPPGAVWAFGHAGYAVYPATSRLIELIVLSLLFGWFLLRFGLFAVVFAHIVLDTTLMCVQLMADGLPGDRIAAPVGFLLPAAVAWLIWLAHRRRNGHSFPTEGRET